jgi:hypothetical protein
VTELTNHCDGDAANVQAFTNAIVISATENTLAGCRSDHISGQRARDVFRYNGTRQDKVNRCGRSDLLRRAENPLRVSVVRIIAWSLLRHRLVEPDAPDYGEVDHPRPV